MLKTLIILVLFFFTINLYAIKPAIDGKYPPSVQKAFKELNKAYPTGNLYNILQKRKARLKSIKGLSKRLQAMKNDIVTIKTPVICGIYADDNIHIDSFPQKLQQELFDGPLATGTMTEYYREISYGQFEVTGKVFDWVHLSHDENYYVNGEAYGFPSSGGKVGELIFEILDSLDNSVDFSEFDNDGDGWVENIFVVHSGVDQADIGQNASENHIWSHRYKLRYAAGSYYVTNDTNAYGKVVKIDDYTIQPEIHPSGEMVQISVFCHEFGHVLGLPDLYDTDYSSGGIGSWGLMCQNRIYYNGQVIEHSPPHMTAWSKEMLGWLVPVNITANTENITIQPVETTPIAYKIWTNGEIESYTPYNINGKQTHDMGKEYFLLEFRKRIGFEKYLMGEGLLIYHILNTRNNGGNSVNTDETKPGVKLLQADGKDDLLYGRNSGDDGDPYPGSTNNRLFDDDTNPSSRTYDGNITMVSIYDISDVDSVMTFSARVKYKNPEFQILSLCNYSNQNRIFSGTTDSVFLKLKNLKADADSIYIKIKCDNEAVTVIDTVIIIKDIPLMDTLSTYDVPIKLSVNNNINNDIVALDITFYNNDDFSQSFNVPLYIGYPQNLVVIDNDKVMNIDSIYNYFSNNIAKFELLNLAIADSSNIAYSKRKNVFWFCGENTWSLYKSNVVDSMKSMLDKGANLFLSGVSAAFIINRTDSLFLSQYFGVRYTGRVKDKKLIRGLNNCVLSTDNQSGKPFVFRLNDNFSNCALVLADNNKAIPMYQYLGQSEVFAGAYKDNGNSKVVLFGFPLDQKDYSYTKDASLEDILTPIVLWFNNQVATPENTQSSSLKHTLLVKTYPNPFNSVMKFTINSNFKTKVQLAIFDLLGRVVYEKKDIDIFTGNNTLTFVPKKLTSGIYFYRIENNMFKKSGKITYLK